MTESEVLKIFENEVIILDCWIEHCKDIISDCETEDDEFDDDKEREELSLKDYTERKEAFDVAITALKEVQQYREIGTVEECREAVEKRRAKIVSDLDYDLEYYTCPSCGTTISFMEDGYKSHKFCLNCGQAILQEDEDD